MIGHRIYIGQRDIMIRVACGQAKALQLAEEISRGTDENVCVYNARIDCVGHFKNGKPLDDMVPPRSIRS